MEPTKIIFLGNKDIGYECLNIFIKKQKVYNTEIVGVLTNNKGSLLGKEATISALALENNIPIISSLQEMLEYENIDYLVSVQYHNILKKEHISVAKRYAINLHMAPLPEYRGCNQFSFAIIDDVKEFGTTLHIIDEGIDSGDILFEKRFQVPQNCYVQDLYKRTYDASVQLFEENIGKIINRQFTRISQKELAKTRSTSFHLRKEIDQIKQIDLSWPKEKIRKYFRATYFPPFPNPVGIIEGKKVEITSKWIEENLG